MADKNARIDAPFEDCYVLISKPAVRLGVGPVLLHFICKKERWKSQYQRVYRRRRGPFGMVEK